MDYLQAIILGFVEGLTEYLPVSSTGHLILTEKLLGLKPSPGLDAFKIVIQFGSILAVVGVFFGRIQEMCRGLTGKSPKGLRLAIHLVVALAITSVFGLTLEKHIKERFFNLTVVAWAWMVGGFLMLAVEIWRRRLTRPGKEIDQLTFGAAVCIGLFQSLALCPGTSRSLATLVGGLLVGLSLPAALEFSFLLGGLTLTAAAGYEMMKHHEAIRSAIDPGPMSVALIAAAMAAWVTVFWMLRIVKRVGLTPFAVYRILLGAAVLGLIWSNRLE